ncbi:hypothetical protein ACIBBB_16170 [Streptomyces sp. NPDC051217]|uniref:hypothetical protein n=1 Tax=Streptomyces sp. NPDC051217 TaxID=3365644 RepID=UPI00378D03B7
MPTWITARRLGATAVLYAVFVGGWYLGQPLPGVGCDTPEPVIAAEGPDTFTEPGQFTKGIATLTQKAVTAEVIDTAIIVTCDGTPRARLVAWVTGDWR